MSSGKFRYKKHFGQNFLHNTSKLGQMTELIDPQSGETILEIGPGAGALTQNLINKARKVIAVELDHEAIAKLESKLPCRANLEIIHGDILHVDLDAILPKEKIKAVGNIPYYITVPIIEKMIENKTRVSKAFFTVQREVAERMVSKEGSKIYGSLSVFCQYHAETTMLLKIDRKSFFPVPKVDSSFVMLDFEKAPDLKVKDEELFFTIVRGGFNQRRKMLINNVKRVTGIADEEAKAAFKSAGIDEKARAEDVGLISFAALANSIYNSRQAGI